MHTGSHSQEKYMTCYSDGDISLNRWQLQIVNYALVHSVIKGQIHIWDIELELLADLPRGSHMTDLISIGVNPLYGGWGEEVASGTANWKVNHYATQFQTGVSNNFRNF